jgi:hypothetical protein
MRGDPKLPIKDVGSPVTHGGKSDIAGTFLLGSD